MEIVSILVRRYILQFMSSPSFYKVEEGKTSASWGPLNKVIFPFVSILVFVASEIRPFLTS